MNRKKLIRDTILGTSTPAALLTNSAAIYSLRVLTANAVKCVTVRRSIDNAETDIFYTSAGIIDSILLLAFSSGGDVFVKTWYDQSGHAIDLSQTTNAAQPKIVSAGAMINVNGKPSINFNGSSNLMKTVTNTWCNTGGEWSACGVIRYNDVINTSGGNHFWTADKFTAPATRLAQFMRRLAAVAQSAAFNTVPSSFINSVAPAIVAGTQYVHRGIRDLVSVESFINGSNTNGALATTGTPATVPAIAFMGAFNDTANFCNCNIQELIHINSSNNIQALAVQEMQRVYYSVY